MKRGPMVTGIVWVGLFFSVASFSATEPLKVTIQSALDSAMSYNPEVRGALEKLNEFDALKSSAWSGLFPTLNATGAATHKKDASSSSAAAFGGNPYNTYKFGFDATQVIYDGGRVFAALSQAEKERRIREYDVKIAERDLTVKMVEAYYSVILSQRKLDNLNKNFEVKRKILSTAQSRYQIGRGQLLDVLQIKTQIALLEPKIAEMENQIEVSAAKLANFMGIKGGQLLEVHGTLDLPPGKFGEEKAEEVSLYELERIKLKLDQFPEQRGISLAKHYPQLNASGSWARNAFTKTDLMDSYATSWSASLQLSIPLFSGFSSVAERKQLASQEAQLMVEEEKLFDQSALDQIKAEKELQLRRKLVHASKKAADYATDSLREAEKNYRLQTADYLQLLQAEQNHLEAQSSFDQARYDYVAAVAKYYAATGLPLGRVIGWLSGGK